MLNSIFLSLFGMGGSEMIVIMVIVLLLFGGKKIPELMKGLGKGMKEFKDASKGEGTDNTGTETTPSDKKN
jgi:sec-independent protein translocase protein TatA